MLRNNLEDWFNRKSQQVYVRQDRRTIQLLTGIDLIDSNVDILGFF